MFQAIIQFFMRFGPWGLFIHSFADAIIFPIPAFFLQVPLSLLDPAGALWLATIGFVACLLGTPFGYYIGKLLGESVLTRFMKPSLVEKARQLFEKNGEAAILVGAFTPIPFKVFTILSGCLKYPLWRLMVYASIGRAVKFYTIGFLFYMYGRGAAGMVDHVSLYICLIAVPLLLIYLFIKRKIRMKNAGHADSRLKECKTQQVIIPEQANKSEQANEPEQAENAGSEK
jgi:membrane protein YqaA with SNARE-associated domain